MKQSIDKLIVNFFHFPNSGGFVRQKRINPRWRFPRLPSMRIHHFTLLHVCMCVASLQLPVRPWKLMVNFLLGMAYFQGRTVSFRECMSPKKRGARDSIGFPSTTVCQCLSPRCHGIYSWNRSQRFGHFDPHLGVYPVVGWVWWRNIWLELECFVRSQRCGWYAFWCSVIFCRDHRWLFSSLRGYTYLFDLNLPVCLKITPPN